MVKLAHSWYPVVCCADKDCHPVPCDYLQHLIDIGRVAKHIIQTSPDQLCHLCTNSSAAHVCAFIPQNLF